VTDLGHLWFRDLPLKRARLQSVWANHPKRQQGKKRTMTTIHT
jgi:hypothetical protein